MFLKKVKQQHSRLLYSEGRKTVSLFTGFRRSYFAFSNERDGQNERLNTLELIHLLGRAGTESSEIFSLKTKLKKPLLLVFKVWTIQSVDKHLCITYNCIAPKSVTALA